MSGESSPKRESTPSYPTVMSSIPQKRVLDDDHQPAVSSPLNPDFKPARTDDAPLARERASRAKKESLKKRESKGGSFAPDYSSARATPDPKPSPQKKKNQKDALAPMRYSLPPPRTADFEVPRGPIFVPFEVKTAPDGTKIQFNATEDHVFNKKNFHYQHCIADPGFPSIRYYRTSEVEPFGPRLNFEDTASHMYLDEGARHITTDKGFRSAKGNISVREGRWYYECKITSGIPKRKRSESHATSESPNGHVRMGWARREATLDAPVGFDAYSYGLRDIAGQKIFMSRPADFLPPGEDICEGDVIGLEITLPSESLHRKIVDGSYNHAVDFEDEVLGIDYPDIIRDRVPIRFKGLLYFEQLAYHATKELDELMNPSPVISSTGGLAGGGQQPSANHPYPSLRTLPNSSIKIYKNGLPCGTAFTDLLAFLPPASKPLAQLHAREGLDDGMLGYYPAISVFRGGACEVNFGPDFWFPPADYTHPSPSPPHNPSDPDVSMADSHAGGGRISKLHTLRAASERYDEQIIEDILYDIIDEVDFWLQDGGDSAHAAANEAFAPQTVQAGGGLGGEEIKELVQDDE